MSIPGLLLRYTAIYVLLLVVAGAVFYVLGIKTNSGINAGVLIGSVYGACLWFSNKNKRYFEGSEKKHAVFGMWVIDMALQFIGVWLAGVATGAELLLSSMLFLLVFIALLHGIAIYFAVGMARQYAKQSAPKA